PLFFFFFNDTATTEIYTLSLHDALPILCGVVGGTWCRREGTARRRCAARRDRKSTRLNSSHAEISYAVFCLKKKNSATRPTRRMQSRSVRRRQRTLPARC